jgi:hypothetical protein
LHIQQLAKVKAVYSFRHLRVCYDLTIILEHVCFVVKTIIQRK